MKTNCSLPTRLITKLKKIKYKCNSRKKIAGFIRNHKIVKLHLGCGYNIIEGWLNADNDINTRVIYLDVRNKFPIDNSVIDYIFCEHLIEHLTFQEGRLMMRECFRTMKIGATIRVSTPDLKFLFELFRNPNTYLHRQYIKWATTKFIPDAGIENYAFVINNFFYNWKHKFIHTDTTLQLLFTHAGFKKITKKTVFQSKDRNLAGLEQHGKIIGKKFNTMETLVFEATKP